MPFRIRNSIITTAEFVLTLPHQSLLDLVGGDEVAFSYLVVVRCAYYVSGNFDVEKINSIRDNETLIFDDMLMCISDTSARTP